MGNSNIYDSMTFLKFIASMGFNPNDCDKILELFQSADGSMSRYLTQFDQYLLSQRVIYDEIDRLGINGAYGYLDENGEILVPKTLENDNRFLNPNYIRLLYKKHSYGAPEISDFGVIIGDVTSQHSKDEMIASLINNYRHKQFMGECIDSAKTDEAKHLIESYKYVVNELNKGFGRDIYTFEHETVNSGGKELCLIKRSK